jgi:hypothetical protein
MLYGKTAELGVNAIDPTTSMILMSADIERITTGWQTIHELWANLIEVGLAIYLLERQLGSACAVPIAVAIGKLPLIFYHIDRTNRIDAFSFNDWILSSHHPGHVSSSHVARSYREAYRCYHCDAQCHERGENVWTYRGPIKDPPRSSGRRIKDFEEIQKAFDLEHGF